MILQCFSLCLSEVHFTEECRREILNPLLARRRKRRQSMETITVDYMPPLNGKNSELRQTLTDQYQNLSERHQKLAQEHKDLEDKYRLLSEEYQQCQNDKAFLKSH